MLTPLSDTVPALSTGGYGGFGASPAAPPLPTGPPPPPMPAAQPPLPTAPFDPSSLTLRQLLEHYAAEVGVEFLPKPGRMFEGLQVRVWLCIVLAVLSGRCAQSCTTFPPTVWPPQVTLLLW